MNYVISEGQRIELPSLLPTADFAISATEPGTLRRISELFSNCTPPGYRPRRRGIESWLSNPATISRAFLLPQRSCPNKYICLAQPHVRQILPQLVPLSDSGRQRGGKSIVDASSLR
jgi:hypothetical protein